MGGSSRGGSGAWEGHAPLKAALDALATAKGVSVSRVKAVANAAFQYAKDYKRVVHDVEMFLWKAEVEHRLAGLYAIDAIMRQSQAKLGPKDMFVKRFLLHMNSTIAAVKKIPADQQESARHVIEEWQSRGYYTPQDIEDAGGHEYSLNNPHARSTSTATSATRPSPSHAEPASKEKLASLLSIIKKQKELQDQKSDLPQAPLLSSPPSQRLRNQAGGSDSSDLRRQPVEQRPRDRSDGNGPRDQVTPSRDRGRDRGRDRSRSRSRDRGRPRDRSRDRSRGRDAPTSSRDRRSPPSSSSPGINRSRPESGYGRRDSFEDGRDAKRPRSSRWGPPRPADSGEDNRPPAIDNRDREGSGRFENRSPRNRYDGPLGPGRAPGQGGYQAPPPPLRSGPSPNAFPPGPQGSGNGYGPASRSGSDLPGPPTRESSYGQGQRNYNGGPAGPSGEYQRPTNVSPSGGDQSTGGPREVCRKFLAGQCTRGDRCWHLHDQPSGPDGAARARAEMNQARRKTVLCANFPQGTCRFGDRCSFAHGEGDLDKSNVATRRPAPLTQDPGRGPSPRGSSPHGSFQSQRQSTASSPQKAFSTAAPNSYSHPPSASAGMHAMPQSFPSYGSGLSSSHASAANAASMPGASNASAVYGQSQPGTGNNPWAGAAAASGYGGYATGQSNQQFGSGGQNPSSSVGAAPTAPAPSRDRAPSRDDDEGEANGPEFNLQYDEDE